MTYSPIMKFFILQVVAVSFIAAAWVLNWLEPLFLTDRTNITFGIAAITLFGITCVGLGNDRWSDFIITILPILGILGTFIGIKITVTGMIGESVELRDFGVGTALNTSITGMIGALWVGLSDRVRK